jgi:hypothetical protein
MDDALNRGAVRNYELTNEVAVLRRRLEQRSRALNAVAERNAAARRALVAVLKVADVTEPVVETTKIHDAIGHEIIGEVMCPQDKFEPFDLVAIDLKPYVATIDELVRKTLGIDLADRQKEWVDPPRISWVEPVFTTELSMSAQEALNRYWNQPMLDLDLSHAHITIIEDDE